MKAYSLCTPLSLTSVFPGSYFSFHLLALVWGCSNWLRHLPFMKKIPSLRCLYLRGHKLICASYWSQAWVNESIRINIQHKVSGKSNIRMYCEGNKEHPNSFYFYFEKWLWNKYLVVCFLCFNLCFHRYQSKLVNNMNHIICLTLSWIMLISVHSISSQKLIFLSSQSEFSNGPLISHISNSESWSFPNNSVFTIQDSSSAHKQQ